MEVICLEKHSCGIVIIKIKYKHLFRRYSIFAKCFTDEKSY